jgi:hypothetical protein
VLLLKGSALEVVSPGTKPKSKRTPLIVLSLHHLFKQIILLDIPICVEFAVDPDPLREICRQQGSTWAPNDYEPTIFTTLPDNDYPNGGMISNFEAGDTSMPPSIRRMTVPDRVVADAISAGLDTLYQTVLPPEIDVHRTIATWTIITAADRGRYLRRRRFTPFSVSCTHHPLTRDEFDRLLAETQRHPETNAVQLAMELEIDRRPTIMTWSGIRRRRRDHREPTNVLNRTIASMTCRTGVGWI